MFGAAMEVELVNDGPVTVVLDAELRARGGRRLDRRRRPADASPMLPFAHHISPFGEMGRGQRPFLFSGGVFDGSRHVHTERELATTIVPTVESAVPGVEVLAVELLSPSRFCVYVDHPTGVDFALCERSRACSTTTGATGRSTSRRPAPSGRSGGPEHFAEQTGRHVSRSAPPPRWRARRGSGARCSGPTTAAVVVSVNGQALPIPVDEIVRGNLIDEDGRS